ncbi:MAG: phospholipid carrier-dependent glycosyltransferase [Clostridia bacterium]|nr:phospholipid carrier-dependent glycosyltransferase [Clostridia bacterium]
MEEVMQKEPLEAPLDKGAKERKNIESWLTEAAIYIGLFLLTLILFLTVEPLIEVQRKGAVAQAIIALGLAAVIALGAYMGMTKRLTTARIIMLLLAAGYIIRVGYMLYTAANARQQDTYSKNFNGHEAYAWTLFERGKLPATNDYQFYHPPLNALIQAGFMKFMQGLTEGLTAIFKLGDYFPSKFLYSKPSYIEDADRWFLYSSCQILSVMYSFITAVVLLKTLSLFKFSDKTKILLSAFVVLYPRQIQFSGMLNNDAISYLLGMLAIYYALKWQKGNKHFAWMLLCGLAVGLGMMAKLSSATVCAPIAGIFIYEFIRTVRKKEGALPFTKMFLQYAVFLLICAPIGLWFQVYANIRFDQEFGHVFSNLNKALSTARHSFFERFFVAFDFTEYFGRLYCEPFSTMNEARTEYIIDGNYNLFAYALKSSIFGEFSYWQGEGFAAAAIVFAYLSAGLLAISLVWATISCIRTRGREDSLFKRADLNIPDLLFVFLLVQSQVLSEVYFYIKMPYGCTMDFRYIMPLILGMALTLGYTRKILAVEGGKFSVALNRFTLISVVAFLTVSTLFYCVCI